MRLRIAAKIGEANKPLAVRVSGISINWLASQNSANGGNSPAGLPRAAGQRYKTFPAIAATFSFRKPRIAALLPTFTQLAKTSKSLRAS